jgi:hypothetical protein
MISGFKFIPVFHGEREAGTVWRVREPPFPRGIEHGWWKRIHFLRGRQGGGLFSDLEFPGEKELDESHGDGEQRQQKSSLIRSWAERFDFSSCGAEDSDPRAIEVEDGLCFPVPCICIAASPQIRAAALWKVGSLLAISTNPPKNLASWAATGSRVLQSFGELEFSSVGG